LKELAGEQLASDHKEPSSTNDESKDTIIPVNHPEKVHIESNTEKQNDIINDDDEDDEDIEFMPTLDELYQAYGDKYAQLADDEESSSEISDDDYILPINKQQLMKYLSEQYDSMFIEFILRILISFFIS
jgi:hypothetical protein